IVFNALGEKAFAKIARKFVGELANRLKERDIHLHVTDAAYDKIAENGVDPVFGARPMKRYIQRYLETDIAKKMIEVGAMKDADIYVDVHDGHFEVKIHQNKEEE
ncbi:MAG: type VI secretion system ATPase TssH, partial [Erysipelotrichaceae bacterium]|nr:type VI secretion system ATPase TssH [Erysipelotrichaceae bacterium]